MCEYLNGNLESDVIITKYFTLHSVNSVDTRLR